MKWLTLATVIIIDQASKWWVVNNLKEVGTIRVIDGLFHLHYLENRGAAFGIFQDQRGFLLVTTLIIVSAIVWYLLKHPQASPLLKWALSLITGGAIGNFIDRALNGFVIDFFDFQVWPVFNVADSAIVVGQVLLVIYILWHHKETEKGEINE